MDESEKRIHELRVGWSTNDTSLQLGEADNSFAYAGNGMAATGNSFDEYAETFAKGKLFFITNFIVGTKSLVSAIVNTLLSSIFPSQVMWLVLTST